MCPSKPRYCRAYPHKIIYTGNISKDVSKLANNNFSLHKTKIITAHNFNNSGSMLMMAEGLGGTVEHLILYIIRIDSNSFF